MTITELQKKEIWNILNELAWDGVETIEKAMEEGYKLAQKDSKETVRSNLQSMMDSGFSDDEEIIEYLFDTPCSPKATEVGK